MFNLIDLDNIFNIDTFLHSQRKDKSLEYFERYEGGEKAILVHLNITLLY